MKYKKVVRLYSNSRVAKYYRATNRNKNKAVMLYFANMKIAQAFHPLLSSFEVIQTLGFWNSFYETHHYALLAGVPCRIFKKLPSGFGRKEINDIIVQVRELRNRINHNEPICFVNRKCDFSYVKGMYAIISDFLTWIDPEIMPSLREIDKVCKIIEKEENKQKQ